MRRTAKSCGPDALTAGVSSQDAKAFCEGGDKQAQSRRGEHEVSRNPSRRESRVVSGYTCGPTPELLPICSGPMGAIGTRLSLRPLLKRGRNEQQGSGKTCRENVDVCLTSCATCLVSSLRTQRPITTMLIVVRR